MFITVYNIQANYNPGAFYLVAQVISSGGTQTAIEVLADDSATANDLHAAIADEARAACRRNNENVDTDATVTIFGAAIQVS